MSSLELRLARLREAIVFPETPDLAGRFEPGPGSRSRPRRLRPLVLGLAVVLAVAAATLTLSPGARSAFLEVLRLRGATIERVEELPEVPTTGLLPLGERVSRAQAERSVGFALLDVGEPDAVYVRRGGPGGKVATLVYGDPARPRLVLTEFRGAIFDGFLKKTAAGGTRIEPVRVRGERGLFISGDAHFVMFLDASGRIADEPTYLAGNTLLWNRGPLLLRLEGRLSRAEALELARAAR